MYVYVCICSVFPENNISTPPISIFIYFSKAAKDIFTFFPQKQQQINKTTTKAGKLSIKIEEAKVRGNANH